MCEVLKCESRELLNETQQIKQRTKDQEVTIENLRKQSDEEQLYVNELTNKMETWGMRKEVDSKVTQAES